MNWLFRLLDRTARLLPLGVMVAALVLFRTAMQSTLARLREVSGESIPDYEILYSRERLIEIFTGYGTEGARLYERFLTFDLAFPLLYSVFFASLLHLVLARSRHRWLALLPLLMAAFDYVENAFFFAFLRMHPDIPEIGVALANVLTLGKFGCGALSAAAGVFAAVLFIRSRLER